MRRAKIVCTLGPASSGIDNIERLVAAGMDVARLNFSHGDVEQHRRNAEDVRRAAKNAGRKLAIIADLSGPKIRIGDLPGGSIELEPGDEIVFTIRTGVSEPRAVSVNYADLPIEAGVGGTIFADDGLLQFAIVDVSSTDVTCRTINGGTLKSRKGLNLPQGGLSIPALTEKDRMDIEFGRSIGVDYFALSFVRKPADVEEARLLAGDIPIIAKIEKPQAIECLEELADAADGFMVARGDLGVEVGAEKVPLLQKRMIRAMNRRAKPVIVATQMLESMTVNPRPTRAEVSDVANALLDGADAVMLSAESAAGKYPFEATRTMARIIEEVESTALASGMLTPPAGVQAPGFDHAVAHAAARAAIDLGLRAVVVHSKTGRSPAMVSAYRPQCAILGFAADPAVVRRMALLWGVTPIDAQKVHEVDDVFRQMESVLLARNFAVPGDQVAITFGMDSANPPGSTTLRLWTVKDGAAGGDVCELNT